jgi:hypothetical protein
MQETQDPQVTHSDKEVALGKSTVGASDFQIQTNIGAKGRSSSEKNDNKNGEEGSDLESEGQRHSERQRSMHKQRVSKTMINVH